MTKRGTLATLFALVIAVPFFVPQAASAQGEGDNPLDPRPSRRQVLVGPVGGVHRNYHSGGFRTIDEDICPEFTNGTGWGYFIGISAEFLPSVNGTWGIIPRVMYEQRPSRFEQTLPDAQVLIPGLSDPVTQAVSVTSDITYSLLTVEVLYKQEFLQLGGLRLAAAAGPQFNYVLGGTNRQVQDLDEPQNARFIPQVDALGNPYTYENNGRRLIFYDGDIPGRKSTRLALKGGLQGEIGLFNNAWILTPGIYYDYGLTSVTDEVEGWSLNSIVFQVDLRRAF